MDKLMTNRNLRIINFVIVSYFILIYLINYYKIDFIIIGVFRELLTIPLLLAQIFFIVIGIKCLIKSQMDFLTTLSFFALAVSTIINFGSFFW